VATVPELDVKMRLGTHCYKHAWHAELWHKRLPELREMNPDRMTVPANDAMVRFVEALTEPEAPELTIEKLVGVYRVFIPRFISAYTFHLNSTSQITGASGSARRTWPAQRAAAAASGPWPMPSMAATRQPPENGRIRARSPDRAWPGMGRAATPHSRSPFGRGVMAATCGR